MSKTRDTGFLANVIQVHDTGVRIMSGSEMLMSISSSGQVTITGELSGSDAANSLLLDGTGSLAFTMTASYNAFSASYGIASASLSSRTTQVERTYATTGSNTFTGPQYISNTSNAIGFTSTASLYSDGGLRVQGNSFVSGTAYFNNIVVYGTSSIQYITSSQVNVGTNIITVNTDTPAIRFGGLSVFDSGSTGLTGSILWDSEKNHWVYSNPSGSTYSGGMFISGPRSSGLGCEQGTTSCMLLVGQGSDHLTSSMIYHDSTVTCVPNTLKIGVDTAINTRNITLAGYPTSICFGNGQSIYDNAVGGLAINGESGIQFLTCATASLNLSSAGFLGIGTTTPCRELHAKGEILFQARSPFSTNNSMYRFIPRSADCAFQFQLMNDSTSLETTVWSVCRNAQTVTSFNIENGNVTIGTNFQIDAAGDFYQKTTGSAQISAAIANVTYPTYGFYLNTGVGMYRESADTLAFTTCATKRLTITSAGIVQIGSTAGSSGMFLTTGNAGITCNNTYFGTGQVRIGGGSDAGANTVLSIAPGVVSVDAPGVSGGRFKLSEAGTLGINCTGVAARTMVVKGATGCYIVAEFIEPAGVHSIEIYPNKNSTNHISSDYMSGGTFLPLSLSGRECTTDLVLGTNGNVGIGISPGTTGKLTVYDLGCVVSLGLTNFACQAKGIDVYNSQSGTTDNVIGYWISTGPHKAGIGSGRTNAAANWEVDLRFYTHPTTIGSLDATCENMRLYGDGSLVTRGGTSSPGLYSDINLKENLLRIPSALNKIKCINGYTFDWKDTAPSRRTQDLLNIIHDAGLIAQEVEEVMPDIVRNNDLSCIKMLNYNGITALLVEGMKEQQCTINTLKTCLGIS